MAKTYRVGVIGRTGKGDYGHGIDTVWKAIPRAQVVAVADENEKGRATAAKNTGAANSYADYREMLAREKLDVVAVGPRWVDCHHEMILACAEHSCHIFMEKPFCRTLAEADDMVRALEMRHLKLAIAHQTRWSPVLDRAKSLIAQGEIGEVLEVRGRGKEDARGGAEDLWVLGSHVMDMLRALFGDATSCDAEVTVGGRRVAKKDVAQGNEGIGPLAGDAVRAVYTFDKGVIGHFASRRNKAGSPSRFGVQIFGTKGVIELGTGYMNPGQILLDSSWSPGRSGAKWQKLTSAGIDKPTPPGSPGNEGGNVAAVNDLLDGIEQDRQPRCSAYEARGTIEMIAAVFESHRQRGPVPIPMKNRMNPLTMLVE